MNTDLAARVSLYRTTSAPLNLIANFFMRGKSVTVVPPVSKLARMTKRTSLLRGA